MASEQSSQVEQGDLTDAQLWLAVTQGHSEALGVLYDRHAGLVYSISLNVLGNAQEAEDLTQDIFVRLIHRSSYDPQRGSLRTFLAVLARSRAIDRVRSRQRETQRLQQQETNLEGAASLMALDQLSQREQTQEVQAALAQLSEQQQQLLKMSYYEGLTQTAIAEHLELPLGTVKSRVRRGLLKLREILQNQLD